MFEKIVQKLQRMSSARSPFDPSSLGDPIALQTEWTAAKRGGANFRTHRLVSVASNRMEFRASLGAKLFYLVFLLAGLGIATGFSVAILSSGRFSLGPNTIFPIFVGLVFAVVGGCLFRLGTAPVVFDKRNGYFWRGRKSPDDVFDKRRLKHVAKLEEIHALQLISEYVHGNKTSYYSYELNLVLEDARRVNVIDHGNCTRLREDAATLASFLGKPIWDAL